MAARPSPSRDRKGAVKRAARKNNAAEPLLQAHHAILQHLNIDKAMIVGHSYQSVRASLMRYVVYDWPHIQAPPLAFGGAEDILAGTPAQFQEGMKRIVASKRESPTKRSSGAACAVSESSLPIAHFLTDCTFRYRAATARER